MFRIDGNIGYTPDFLIKYEADGVVKYAVLDSKYSKKSVLKKYQVLRELLVKYCLSISSKTGLSPAINFMWILQGRNDDSRTYYFQDSVLSRKYSPKVSYGIYALNKKEDNMEEIWEELMRVVLNSQ